MDACSLGSSGCGLAPALREDSLPPWLPFIVFNLGLRWVFTAACRLSRVAPSRGYSLVAVRGLLNVLAPPVWSTGSKRMGLAAQGTWDLPRPGTEPASLHCQVGFPTTGPQRTLPWLSFPFPLSYLLSSPLISLLTPSFQPLQCQRFSQFCP